MPPLKSILHLFVNDFKLCDILNGRRKLWQIDITLDNCKQLVSCNLTEQPIIENGHMIPVHYTHVIFESKHLTLKGESCCFSIHSLKSWVNIPHHIKSNNPYYGYGVTIELGQRESTSIETDYSIKID